MNSRKHVLQILSDVVIRGKSLNYLLSEQDPFVKAFCFEFCRWYFQLIGIANELITKPFKEKDQDIYLLILMGICELQHLQTAEHATVQQTAELARLIKKPWAVAVINGVLRNFIRKKNQILEKIKPDLQAYYAHPLWIIEKLKKDWGEDYEKILSANNQHPPFTLRVDLKKISREDFLKKIVITAIKGSHSDAAIYLEEAMPVEKLPGFSQGEVFIQDEAAQLAVPLLKIEKNMQVLDACAAPGGKLIQMLQSYSDNQFTAIDIDPKRIEKITQELKRLNLTANLIVGDATQDKFLEQKMFDRILLDAPCSATGILRRHPDGKILKRKDDLKHLPVLQLKILKKLWQHLKPNGLLLYCTCSIMPEENWLITEKFLQQEKNAKEVMIDKNWGRAMPHGRQILPGEDQMDGFYYCLLQKI